MGVSMKTSAYDMRKIRISSKEAYISWPASRTASICFGNVSKLWPTYPICQFLVSWEHWIRDQPGMNQVVLILYLSNSFRRRGTPTSPAYIPCTDLSSQSYSTNASILERCPMANLLLHRIQACIVISITNSYHPRTKSNTPTSHSVNIDAESDENFSSHGCALSPGGQMVSTGES